jgi:hypothetical protein
MEALSCLGSLFLFGSAAAILVFLITCIRRVKEGHVVVIERWNKFVRTGGPGPYLLWPTEGVVGDPICIRQREMVSRVPEVTTEGGLLVTVNLRFAFSLDPKQMQTDELYYTDEQRGLQLERLLKRVFQEVLYKLEQTPLEQLPSSAASAPPADIKQDRVDIEHLFSPFAGRKKRILQSELELAVRSMLRPHGFVVSEAPVVIYRLVLAPEIQRAYLDLVSTDFNSTARSDFIRRVRDAAPHMTEAGLIQLFNIIQNPTPDVHSVFSGGMLHTEMSFPGNQSETRHVVQPDTGAVNPPPAAPAAGGTGASAQQAQVVPPYSGTQPRIDGNDADQPQVPAGKSLPAPAIVPSTPSADSSAGPDYPLTEDDNELLKSVRQEIV